MRERKPPIQKIHSVEQSARLGQANAFNGDGVTKNMADFSCLLESGSSCALKPDGELK
jgi:hypothetical protein